MAKVPILEIPDPRLRQKALPVERVDAGIARLMEDMLETMYAAPGVGLAAPQVGVLSRVLVVDVAAGDDSSPAPLRMANPEILWASTERTSYKEGCLSLPEQYAEVTRPCQVRVRYLDQRNAVRVLEADGLLATVLQHEIDHLEGVLFVDHVSKLKRDMILRRLQKTRRVRESA
ncbi:MAG: peptide deformylase [Rhodospirillaceae bacterium]|nr:MAG: peptide deformylase [Rhodospirillaceae bacterium]